MSTEDIVNDVANSALDSILARVEREHARLSSKEREELKWLVLMLVGRRLHQAARDHDTRSIRRPGDAARLQRREPPAKPCGCGGPCTRATPCTC